MPSVIAVLRGLEERLFSFADWKRALHAISHGRRADHGRGEGETPEENGGIPAVDMFEQSVWDILLYLFVLHANGRAGSLSGSSRAAGLAKEITSRRIDKLAADRLVILNRSRTDTREMEVRLSPHGFRVAEEGMQGFVMDGLAQRVDAARNTVGETPFDQRIAHELKINLESVELHRANVTAKRIPTG
ncbi:hypothetical protein L5849_07265 [Erythrobacter sp. SN021]|uniref:hypothetical protein n=1 Tax=Erythrobacter sp. SN021 TaxID=2912574 RepID=UPI001F30FD39|nr:hypothetical protein [Erythrobacter sp. SN021]MCF8882494.1 hypothetical protein [Erythrobacter sp. SN021]